MSTNELNKVLKSYKTVLEIMEHNGFETHAYSRIGQNELEIMLNNGEHNLDILLKDPKTGKKVYIKYFLKMPNEQNIITIAETLFNAADGMVKETDALFIIVCSANDRVSDTQYAKLSSIWLEYGYLVVMEHIDHLQFNKLTLQIVPPHHIMTDEEIATSAEFAPFRTEQENLATISRFDPIARLLCARPGQIIRITRPSETAITAPYWRRVIN